MTQCHRGGILGLPQGWGDFFFPWRAQTFPLHSGSGWDCGNTAQLSMGGGVAMLGPDGSAQPLLVSAPPGAEAPAGTRCSAPHPPSGSRRCKVTGKSTGWKGRTQPRSRSFPGSPSLQHASLLAGGGGRTRGRLCPGLGVLLPSFPWSTAPCSAAGPQCLHPQHSREGALAPPA